MDIRRFFLITLVIACLATLACANEDLDDLLVQQKNLNKELARATSKFYKKLPNLPEYQKAQKEYNKCAAAVDQIRASKGSDSDLSAASKARIAAQAELQRIAEELESHDAGISDIKRRIANIDVQIREARKQQEKSPETKSDVQVDTIQPVQPETKEAPLAPAKAVAVGAQQKNPVPAQPLAGGAGQAKILVNVVDEKGAPLSDAEVTVVLDSGAYQDAKFEDGKFECDATQEPAHLFIASPRRQGCILPIAGKPGLVTVRMKSTNGSSAILHGRGRLRGIDGTVDPLLDNLNRTYMYADQIGFLVNGKPAPGQPLQFKINEPITAISPQGKPFNICVRAIVGKVSLLEYTLPQ